MNSASFKREIASTFSAPTVGTPELTCGSGIGSGILREVRSKNRFGCTLEEILEYIISKYSDWYHSEPLQELLVLQFINTHCILAGESLHTGIAITSCCRVDKPTPLIRTPQACIGIRDDANLKPVVMSRSAFESLGCYECGKAIFPYRLRQSNDQTGIKSILPIVFCQTCTLKLLLSNSKSQEEESQQAVNQNKLGLKSMISSLLFDVKFETDGPRGAVFGLSAAEISKRIISRWFKESSLTQQARRSISRQVRAVLNGMCITTFGRHALSRTFYLNPNGRIQILYKIQGEMEQSSGGFNIHKLKTGVESACECTNCQVTISKVASKDWSFLGIPLKCHTEFEISVTPCTHLDILSCAHLNRSKSSTVESNVLVQRRYSDFNWLYTELYQLHHMEAIVCRLPPPKVWGRFNGEFLHQRCLELQKFLQSVIKHPVLSTSLPLQVFLHVEFSRAKAAYMAFKSRAAVLMLLRGAAGGALHGASKENQLSNTTLSSMNVGYQLLKFDTAPAPHGMRTGHRSCSDVEVLDALDTLRSQGSPTALQRRLFVPQISTITKEMVDNPLFSSTIDSVLSSTTDQVLHKVSSSITQVMANLGNLARLRRLAAAATQKLATFEIDDVSARTEDRGEGSQSRVGISESARDQVPQRQCDRSMQPTSESEGQGCHLAEVDLGTVPNRQNHLVRLLGAMSKTQNTISDAEMIACSRLSQAKMEVESVRSMVEELKAWLCDAATITRNDDGSRNIKMPFNSKTVPKYIAQCARGETTLMLVNRRLAIKNAALCFVKTTVHNAQVAKETWSKLLPSIMASFNGLESLSLSSCRENSVQAELEITPIQTESSARGSNSLQLEDTDLQLPANEHSESSTDHIQEIDALDLTIGKLIGRGNFGQVYDAVYHGQRVAVKKFAINPSAEALQSFRRETAVMRRLPSHPNLVAFFGASTRPLCLVMELVRGGTLSDLLLTRDSVAPKPFIPIGPKTQLSPSTHNRAIRLPSARQRNTRFFSEVAHHSLSNRGRQGNATVHDDKTTGPLKAEHRFRISLTIPQKINIALQAAKGLAALHQCRPQILHRDIKTSNLLCGFKGPAPTPSVEGPLGMQRAVDRNQVVVKVCDFGLSRFMQEQHRARSFVGTATWVAPEVIQSKKGGYSDKADVYSFGIVLWQIFARAIVYPGLHTTQVLFGVCCEDLRPDLSVLNAPTKLTRLMQQCWHTDPSRRPSFEIIVMCLKDLLETCETA